MKARNIPTETLPNVAAHPLFEPADIAALGAENGTTVSFIGVPIRIGFKVVGTLEEPPSTAPLIRIPPSAWISTSGSS